MTCVEQIRTQAEDPKVEQNFRTIVEDKKSLSGKTKAAHINKINKVIFAFLLHLNFSDGDNDIPCVYNKIDTYLFFGAIFFSL